MNTPTYNPVYKSLNKPLTVWGVERRLFFVAMIVGAATFSCFNSLLGAIVMFSVLFFCAKQATRTDAQILRVLLNSSRFKPQYDPVKRTPYHVEAIRHGQAQADR